MFTNGMIVDLILENKSWRCLITVKGCDEPSLHTSFDSDT